MRASQRPCAGFGDDEVPAYAATTKRVIAKETLRCRNNGAQLIPRHYHNTLNINPMSHKTATSKLFVVLDSYLSHAPPCALFIHDTHDSLNDIPGRDAGRTATRVDSVENWNHQKTARFSEPAVVSEGGSPGRRGGRKSGTGRGVGDTQEADSAVLDHSGRMGEEQGAGSSKRQDADDLVYRKLTWRYLIVYDAVVVPVSSIGVGATPSILRGFTVKTGWVSSWCSFVPSKDLESCAHPLFSLRLRKENYVVLSASRHSWGRQGIPLRNCWLL